MNWYTLLSSIGLFVLIIIVGYIAGRLTRRALSYIVYKIGGDELFKKFSIGRAIIRAGYAPSEFFGLLVSWIIYIGVLLVALTHLGQNLELPELYETSNTLLGYLYGFVKAFIIIVIGFMLVDAFIGYIYSSSEDLDKKGGLATIMPAAEYLRIVLYVVVLIFALEQAGIPVQTLWVLITPVIWGLTVIIVIIAASGVVKRVLGK